METIYPDIPRICTAMAEWIMCFAYVSFLPKRYTGRKNILFCIIALLLQIFILVSTANMPLKYWILCMILAAGCMFAFIYMCCELTTGQALYCYAIAFILAGFIASLEWQLYIYLLKWNLQFPGENLSVLMVENSEKRMIHLSLTQKNDFIFIQIRNYCEKEPVWKGKELLTTKKIRKIMVME